MGRTKLSLLAGVLFWSGYCVADEYRANGGQGGELHISGSFLEAPCGLVMRSEFQDVLLDSSVIASLQKPGDTGEAKQITFHLVGCKTAQGQSKLTGRDATIRFLSVADPDEPTLFRMNGITGIGLRLQDKNGRLVVPGETRKPLFSSSAMDALTYTVVLVRTKAPLSTGNFEATVDFGMSYE